MINTTGRTPKPILRCMPICAIACLSACAAVFYNQKLLAVAGIVFLLLCAAAIKRFRNMLIPLIAASLVLLSLMDAVICLNKLEPLDGSTCELEFTVTEEPTETIYGYSAVAAPKDDILPHKTKILVYYSDKYELKAGQTYKAELKLKTVKKNKQYYYSENIFISSNLRSEPKNVGSSRLYTAAARVRAYIRSTLYSQLDADEASTLNALTVGERSGFSEKFSLYIRRAGVSHIMVVSGMHLTVIMSAVFFVINKITHNKYIRVVFALLAVFILSALCGFTVSILRAGLTYCIMALAALASRDRDSLSALGSAAVIILVHSPFAVFSISFQLSMLSTFGILVFTSSVKNELKFRSKKRHKWIITALTPLIITLSASFMTLPVVIWHFEEVSLIAPISNILLSLAVTAALVCAAAALIINLLPFGTVLSSPIFFAAQLIAKYINLVITLCGQNEYVTVDIPQKLAFPAAIPTLFSLSALYFFNYLTYRRFQNRIKEAS